MRWVTLFACHCACVKISIAKVLLGSCPIYIPFSLFEKPGIWLEYGEQALFHLSSPG